MSDQVVPIPPVVGWEASPKELEGLCFSRYGDRSRDQRL